jgi:excisionase family DNA binding protein
MTEIETVYSVEEAAKILKISERLVRFYIRNGRLKATKIGKYYRIKESNVLKLIENGNCD